MPMTMRRPASLSLPPPTLPLLRLVLLQVLLQLVQHTHAELEPALTGLEPSSARARIKSITENMSNVAGDSFNIRHGRSRGHMLSNNSNSGSSRLTQLGDGSHVVLPPPPPPPPPTHEPGAGGATAAPVTHKIRKLHKKKINESIRKSVDKSLGVLHSPKNHRSLAEAEHLQGRPTDVEDDVALDEVMQLADEIDLENSLASAFQQRQLVVDLVTELATTPAAAVTPSTPPTDATAPAAALSTQPAGRHFVRVEADADANYEEDSDEDAQSTTQIATFAPHQVSWQLQQTRIVGRTRLLPVNRSSSSSTTSSAAPATGVRYDDILHASSDADYRLEGDAVDDDVDDDADANEDGDGNAELQATEADANNSTEYAIGEWPDTELDVEVGARSQASTRRQQHEQRENMEVKQINFNYESDSESESVLDTSEVTMDDGYPPEVLIDDNSKQLVIGDVVGNGVEGGDTNGDGVDSNQITADVINARDSKIDLVSKFLQYIEQQHLMGSNCVAGTSLNLGEGVVDRYAQDRFRVEAEVAVNRANMLTR